jgi:hypothetical protein
MLVLVGSAFYEKNMAYYKYYYNSEDLDGCNNGTISDCFKDETLLALLLSSFSAKWDIERCA